MNPTYLFHALKIGFRRGMCRAGAHKMRGVPPHRVCIRPECGLTEAEWTAAQTARSASDVVRPVGDGDSLRSSPPRTNKMPATPAEEWDEEVEAQISPELSAKIDRWRNEEDK